MNPIALIGAAAAALGVAGMLVSAVCLLRFPDFYTRLHAMRFAGRIGAPLVLAGVGLGASEWTQDWTFALKLAALAGIFVLLGGPAAHILASAAHGAGLAPYSKGKP